MVWNVWRVVASRAYIGSKALVLSSVISSYAILALSTQCARGLEVIQPLYFDRNEVAPGWLNNRSIRIELMAEGSMPISYFVERMPDDGSLPSVPDGATGVVVAKVRLQQPPSYLGGRDQSGDPPKNLPRDIFFTRLKISDVLRGGASAGQVFDVRFGLRGDKRKLIYPYTPDQLDREYVVVMYLDASDGRRRLAPFSITGLQYSQWEIEQSAYTRLRGKPGSRE
jgi:hypothetical protein